MTTRLERTYRRALRWYPTRWRILNGETVVSTLLDQAETQGRTTARITEIVNLAMHGLGLRLFGALVRIPAGVRDRAASVSLGTGSMFSLVLIVRLELRPTTPPYGYPWEDTVTFGPFASPMIVIYALWLAGFVATMVGLDRTARWLIALTLPLMLVVRIVADAQHMWLRPTATTMVFFAMLALIVLAGKPLSRRAANIRTGMTALVSLVVLGAANWSAVNGVFRDPPLFASWTLMQSLWWIPLIAIVAAISLRLAHQSAWAAAALLLAAPWTAVAVFGFLTAWEIVEYLMTIIAVGAMIVLAGVVLRLLGVRIHVEPAAPAR